MNLPETLVEAVRKFSNLDYATEFFAKLRWGSVVCCPHCGSVEIDYIAKRRVWECRSNHPKRQFSVKIGTIFEECRLPIDKCLIAIWLEVNAKNSISSYEVARHLGVTQKTAWFLQHRIREALRSGSIEKIGGAKRTVEADEMFVGGLFKNMHISRRKKLRKLGGPHKTIVMGLLERHTTKGKSKVKVQVVPNTSIDTLHGEIVKRVNPIPITFILP
ncbi:MAG TPA: IS1595 family transposase [Phycisphaerae bacterium]|nr:IS1595 family transposase [Phycisphaerae bacterium]